MAKQISNKAINYRSRANISSPRQSTVRIKAKPSKDRDAFVVEATGHFVWETSSKSKKI